MKILLMIFFFGVAISLIVLKGIFISREFQARIKQSRLAKPRRSSSDRPEPGNP